MKRLDSLRARYQESIYGGLYHGRGTAENPYLISDIEDLVQLKYLVNDDFYLGQYYLKLMRDLDFTDSTSYRNPDNLAKMRTIESIHCNGKSIVFDGNNCQISNLDIIPCLEHPLSPAALFIGDTYFVFKDLCIHDAVIHGQNSCSAVLCTQAKSIEAENISLSGNVNVEGTDWPIIFGDARFQNHKVRHLNTSISYTRQGAHYCTGYGIDISKIDFYKDLSVPDEYYCPIDGSEDMVAYVGVEPPIRLIKKR